MINVSPLRSMMVMEKFFPSILFYIYSPLRGVKNEYAIYNVPFEIY
ncbi:hypothetical protein Cabys_1202 [Caldithrix abyssi DSM 13497]|uniref:Uncharacterized protein n=1 Tax=Caldithrix abyssi DSM 13497 TaxID=880073 RepID=A0A1J1C5N5_CALAY|nr:hypothetical protein Cabys_1202 [Caldithrix abyssi DSM 13497]